MTEQHRCKVFASPERYVQGRNAMEMIGSEMKGLGMKGPVIVVSSPTPRRELEATWSRVLQENGYEFSSFSFGGVCTGEEADRICSEAQKIGAKSLVAVGGGQVIDVVRAAAALANCDLVSCPTIASTDAPTSALCVMYKPDRSFDEYRFVPRHPTLVLVDTCAVARAPKRFLVGGLGDALATYFEARTVREAHAANFLGGGQTEAGYALSKLCYEILITDGPAAVQAVEVNAVTPVLERVVEANTLLSGLGFENGGLCVAHSVHNGLTGQAICANYTHGEKVSFGLIIQLVLEGRPPEEVNTVLDFCVKVGLPVTLREVGLDSQDDEVIREIAEKTLAPGESAHNEPFPLTAEMVAEAIKVADRRGALFKQNKAC